MPWVRFGDNAATYPKLLLIAGFPGAGAKAVNEFRGWLCACATQSGGHKTDYRIDPGTAALFGGARTKVLVGWGVRAGLLTPVDVDGIEHWDIIEDPEFIHIRLRAELEWEAQRKLDVANTALTVPVRLRDGDQCRYCGLKVEWMGRKSNRSAEYDHRNPGEAAKTPADLVVACRSCNGARRDDPTWDESHPLRLAPTHPRYGAVTATFLTNNGHPTTPNLGPGATTGAASSAAPAPHQERPAAPQPTRQDPEIPATGPAEVPAELPAKSTSNRLPGSAGTGLAGSGRVGSGPVRPGEGRTSPGPGGSPPPRRKRRGKRGRKPAPDSTTTTSEGGTAP